MVGHGEGDRHVTSQGRREQGMVMEGEWPMLMSVTRMGSGWMKVHGERGRHTLR